jgi:hypothetical protein
MMKEDYLWNKTGSDANVEEIENALQVFRFKADEPPELPSTVVTVKERPRFSFFRLGFALAFAVVFVVAISLFWLRTPNKSAIEHIATDNSPQHILPQIDPTTSATPIIEPPMPKRALYTKRPSIARPVKASVRKTYNKADTLNLTAEEKHAYDQLMLALSITSNELKFVKDKIYGREEREAANDKQK